MGEKMLEEGGLVGVVGGEEGTVFSPSRLVSVVGEEGIRSFPPTAVPNPRVRCDHRFDAGDWMHVSVYRPIVGEEDHIAVYFVRCCRSSSSGRRAARRTWRDRNPVVVLEWNRPVVRRAVADLWMVGGLWSGWVVRALVKMRAHDWDKDVIVVTVVVQLPLFCLLLQMVDRLRVRVYGLGSGDVIDCKRQ